MTPREELLAEATKIVSHDRNKAYGNPEDNFRNIADYWNVYNNQKPHIGTNSMDVAIMMMLMKIARLATNPMHRDSLLDIAGYAACGADIQESRKGPPPVEAADMVGVTEYLRGSAVQSVLSDYPHLAKAAQRTR
jgi:hypothetical protein